MEDYTVSQYRADLRNIVTAYTKELKSGCRPDPKDFVSRLPMELKGRAVSFLYDVRERKMLRDAGERAAYICISEIPLEQRISEILSSVHER